MLTDVLISSFMGKKVFLFKTNLSEQIYRLRFIDPSDLDYMF